MSNLSRRSLVASAAALPALTVPALASFSPDHPDAELLRLAVQLEAVGLEVAAECERADKHSTELRAACERAGMPDIAASDWPGGVEGPGQWNQWWEYQNKRMALVPKYDEYKDENGNTIMDRLTNRLSPIVDEIMAKQPSTLDGLRVLARALAVHVPGFWDNDFAPTEMDFIGAVFTFLGLDGRQARASRRNA